MPTFGAAAVVIDDGKILLMKRRDVEVWSLPGGAIEADETVAQAAVREVLEETGIDIALTRLVGIYSRPQWRAGGDHGVVFAGRPLTHKITPQPEEAIEAGYFSPDDLPEPMAWWVVERINDAMNGVTGAVWLQDAVWPDHGEDWREKMEQSPLAPSEFYEKHFTEIGPRGEKIEVPGAQA